MRRLALIAAAGIVLAGCGGGTTHTSGPAPRSHYPVVVHSPVVAPTQPHGGNPSSFARLVSPTRLALVTTGSSSCPSVPDEIVTLGPDTIRIHLTVGSRTPEGFAAHPPPSGICTADFGTTSMLVAIDPKKIDVYRPLTVRFLYHDSKKPLVRVAAPLKS